MQEWEKGTKKTPKAVASPGGERRSFSPKLRVILQRRRRRRIAAVSMSAILLFLLIFLIAKSFFGNKEAPLSIKGNWRYDEYTKYEFDENGNGCMCLEDRNHYEFRYLIKGDLLKMDYALDYVTDCEYTFSVKGDKLILIGGKGTVQQGKRYELIKEKNNTKMLP